MGVAAYSVWHAILILGADGGVVCQIALWEWHAISSSVGWRCGVAAYSVRHAILSSGGCWRCGMFGV